MSLMIFTRKNKEVKLNMSFCEKQKKIRHIQFFSFFFRFFLFYKNQTDRIFFLFVWLRENMFDPIDLFPSPRSSPFTKQKSRDRTAFAHLEKNDVILRDTPDDDVDKEAGLG